MRVGMLVDDLGESVPGLFQNFRMAQAISRRRGRQE
jgi:hypothetical protein